MAEPKGNLAQDYPPAALIGWQGCSHLDCLPDCRMSEGQCERLAQLLKRNGWIGKVEKRRDLCALFPFFIAGKWPDSLTGTIAAIANPLDGILANHANSAQ